MRTDRHPGKLAGVLLLAALLSLSARSSATAQPEVVQDS